MTEAELVHLDIDRGIATITLDSPHNRNALSAQLVTELGERLRTADGDAGVRAVVLTHSGTTFCAGADLSEARGGSMTGTASTLLRLIRGLIDTSKPVIASIDGNVRAGGLGLIGACDIVVAGPRCTFALTEVRLGLAAAVISVALLPRLDERAAARYFLTGETFDTAEAVRIGAVTVAADDIRESTAAITAHLLKGSPQGLAESKRLITARVRATIDADGERMVELSARLFASEEAREGMVAFLERRPPRWAV
ncbi:MAG TPA: enoyl-CoA hydratase family protein [Candidatus Acidoferrales bacterium]|nr:enoyl-CoA hydratase family protein [Candidatus Acidoferrales bacterium]